MEFLKIDVTFETFMESKKLARAGVPGGKQGCWIWYSGSQLVDLQIGDGVGGRILSIRNPISKGIKPSQINNGKAKRSKPLSHQVVIFSAIVVPGVLLLLCCAGFICCRRTNIKKVQAINSIMDVFRKTEKYSLNGLIINFNLFKLLLNEFIVCLLMKGLIDRNFTVCITWFGNHSSDIWTIHIRIVD
nr:apple-like protein [Tanacetum cinerariifolium]